MNSQDLRSTSQTSAATQDMPKMGLIAGVAVAALGVLFAIAAQPMSAQGAKTATWVPATPPGALPSAVQFSGAAYYPDFKTVVMFDDAGKTCLWNGSSWSCATYPNGPGALAGAALAYDAVHKNIVLFGGLGLGSGNSGNRNDTYIWNGSDWALQNPTTKPPARFLPGIATQPASVSAGGVVMFGGTSDGNAGLDDTYTWDGTNWTLQTTPVALLQRLSPGMTLDSILGEVVLFGGYTDPNPAVTNAAIYYADTWLWTGTGWSSSTATGPSARTYAGFAYDAAVGEDVLFGGNTSSSPVIASDTWTFNGTWTRITPAFSPPPTSAAVMVYDSTNASVVLFGGASDANGAYPGADTNNTYNYQVPSTVFVANHNGNAMSTYYSNTVATTNPIAQLNTTAEGTNGGIGAAVDSAGAVWSLSDNGNTLTAFSNLGTTSTSYARAQTGVNGGTALAIDGANTKWITESGSLYAVNNAGASALPAGITGIAQAGGIDATPASISVDSSGSLWIANPTNSTVTEVIGAAAPITTPTVVQTGLTTLGIQP